MMLLIQKEMTQSKMLFIIWRRQLPNLAEKERKYNVLEFFFKSTSKSQNIATKESENFLCPQKTRKE